MSLYDPYDFDIDVDLSPLFGEVEGPSLISARWYDLLEKNPERVEALERKIHDMFQNEMMRAQWNATQRRKLDRRRAIRAPLISRVHVDAGPHLVATDVSLSGLRCSGTPTAPVMDIEFKLPGAPFPIDAKAEVVSYKDSNVIPLVGMRFAWIDKPYVEIIAEYVARRREKLQRAA